MGGQPEEQHAGAGSGVNDGSDRAPDALPSHPVALGRQLGRYRLLAHLGRGGMADVYLADELDEQGSPRPDATRVVVKEVLPRLHEDAAFSRGLMAEAELALHLRHPNVVHTIALGEDAAPFIVMEYVPGLDLHQLLRALTASRQGLHAAYAFHIMERVLRGLHAAHEACDDDGEPLGVVHCDVSPANVLLGVDGGVKVCDFGVARAEILRLSPAHAGFVDSEEWALDSDTTPGHVAGKWRYLAPEQASGQRFDLRADVFAAGVMLWELCAGRPILRAPRDLPAEELLRLAAERRAEPLPVQGFPEQARLQDILDRALQREPAARFQNASVFTDALASYVADNGMAIERSIFADYITHVCDTVARPAWPLRSDERSLPDELVGEENATERSAASASEPPAALADESASDTSRAAPPADEASSDKASSDKASSDEASSDNASSDKATLASSARGPSPATRWALAVLFVLAVVALAVWLALQT